LIARYGIDQGQAQRVEATALHLFDQVQRAWALTPDDRMMLMRAARVHELGLAIAHSQYHVHGAYVLENSDIAGFSQQEQRVLAALVRTHRRAIGKNTFEQIPDRLLLGAKRTAALLRIAVLLHRSHEAEIIPLLDAEATPESLTLQLDKRWYEQRPLLRQDLEAEPAYMAGLGVQLRIAAR